MNYRSAAKTVTTGSLQGQAASVYSSLYGSYLDYQVPSTDEMQKVSDELRAALGLKSETINNENVKENTANSGFSWNTNVDQTYTIYNPDL